jgi:hypothetical protein
MEILEDNYDNEVELVPPKAFDPSIECIPLYDP